MLGDPGQKIICIIPAKDSSKGIHKKNLVSLCGRPLIDYIIDSAKKSFYIEEIYVSTDDKEIASIAKENGRNVPFLRPKELTTDNSPVIDTVIHAVNWWEEHHKDAIHSVLFLQPKSFNYYGRYR